MKKLGVVFGGMSTENKVSIVSANSVLQNLDKNKYEIYPIYIDEQGKWWKAETQENMEFGEKVKTKKEIENITKYLKNLDVIFPVLHGLYGEDGTIQGLFELLKIPYVGCHVLASSVGMDKVYSKIIFEKAGLKQTKYVYIKKCDKKYIYVDEDFDEEEMELNYVAQKISGKLKFPVFVKPSNSGSSVGINKANNISELEKYIEEAAKYDRKILVEEGINGREIECAVMGNETVVASHIGEVKAADEFYSYDAKYNNKESKTEIPAKLPSTISEEIRKIAIKAFESVNGEGLARVDFFVEEGTNKIILNEINTMPGFTQISMYPQLWEQSGIKYSKLLDKLIELANK